MPTAFTDLVSIAIVMGVMIVIDLMAYKMRFGTFYIVAGVLGVYTTGNVFNNGYVNYLSAYDQASASFKVQPVDANLIVVVLACLTIVSFLFIYFERNSD